MLKKYEFTDIEEFNQFDLKLSHKPIILGYKMIEEGASQLQKSYFLTASDGWLSASEEFTASETKSDMILQFVCYNKAFQIDNVSIREI